ncbi:MAG: PE family protein, partial [Gemmatimonadota bacterium]
MAARIHHAVPAQAHRRAGPPLALAALLLLAAFRVHEVRSSPVAPAPTARAAAPAPRPAPPLAGPVQDRHDTRAAPAAPTPP